MFYKISLLFFAAILSVSTVSAQDIDFNQWQANYMALNPAMTGISNNPRIHFAHRQQMVYFTLHYHENGRSTIVNYDQRISPKAGYIGVSYLNDMIGSAKIGTQSLMLHYARNYEIQISDKTSEGKFGADGKLNLRFGIALSGFERSIDGAKLQVFSQRNPRTGKVIEVIVGCRHKLYILASGQISALVQH